MIKIYTDGSTRNNGYDGNGAWGFIAVDENNSVLKKEAEAVNHTTNQQCELMAIIHACNWAASNDLHNITIISDSAYAINCYNQKWYDKWLKNGWTASNKQPVKNQELWEKLIPYFCSSNFNFIKVKGHAGNKFNEEVDKLVQELSMEGKR